MRKEVCKNNGLPVAHGPVLMPCVVRHENVLPVLEVLDDHRAAGPVFGGSARRCVVRGGQLSYVCT